MLGIKFLSGDRIGEIIPLSQGKITLGRSPQCHIAINNPGISKIHAEIMIFPDKLILSDQKSRNGTFVNGVRIQNNRLNIGDTLALHDVYFEIVEVSDHQSRHLINPNMGLHNKDRQHYNSFENQSNDFDSENSNENMPHNEDLEAPHIKKLADLPIFFKYYLEKVLLPGIYHLVELFQFKYVLGGLIFILVISITCLSVIPMMRITRSSVEIESQRRALTIATHLASSNERAVLQQLDSGLSTYQAQIEEGVKTALIINGADGNILAPVQQAGTFSSHPFVAQARRTGKTLVFQIDDHTVGASVPINYFSPEKGTQVIAAYAIVIYDMGSLAIDDGRTLSLFFQTLTMALLVGLLIYYFIYRLIEFPIHSINRKLDQSLRENNDNLELKFEFPVLQQLISNINTILSRGLRQNEKSENFSFSTLDRYQEAENLLRIIGLPGLAVSAQDNLIIGSNDYFDQITNCNGLKNSKISSIPDVALQQNITNLISKIQSQPNEIASDSLDFGGANYEIHAQSILGNDQIAYFLITIHPKYEEELAS